MGLREHASDNLSLFGLGPLEMPGSDDGEFPARYPLGVGFLDPLYFADVVGDFIDKNPGDKVELLAIALQVQISKDAPMPAWAVADGVDPSEYLRDEKLELVKRVYPGESGAWQRLRAHGFTEAALLRLGAGRFSYTDATRVLDLPNHVSPAEGVPRSPFFVGTHPTEVGKAAVRWFVRARFGRDAPPEEGTYVPYNGEQRYPDYREDRSGHALEWWHEVKAGRVKDGEDKGANREIQKDLSAVGVATDGVEWHFFVSGTSNSIGPNTALLEHLEAGNGKGITATLYPALDDEYSVR